MLDFGKDQFTELLNNLIKIGVVSSVDYAKCTARVEFADDGIVSFNLPVLHTNSSRNRDYAMPDVGENVLCLFLPSGNEEGFILGSFYAGNTPPETSGNARTVVFKDGTRISYDREAHKLTAEIDGTTIFADRQNVKIATGNNVEITAANNVLITAANNITANAVSSATIESGNVFITGTGSVTVNAPSVSITGTCDVSGALTVNSRPVLTA